MGDEASRIIDIAEPDGKSDVDGDPAANNGTAKPNRTPEKLNGYPTAEPATVKLNKNGNRTGLHNRTRPRDARGNFISGTAIREETAVSKTIEKVSLTELLFSLHMMGAALLAPELELDKEESKKLAEAVKEVGKHYAMEVNPKYVAIANLGAVAGFLYGPRVVAYRARKEAARERKPQAGPVVVEVPKPQPENPAPVPEAKVNGTAAARNPRQMAPSELWPEPAGDWAGLG